VELLCCAEGFLIVTGRSQAQSTLAIQCYESPNYLEQLSMKETPVKLVGMCDERGQFLLVVSKKSIKIGFKLFSFKGTQKSSENLRVQIRNVSEQIGYWFN
jgi:hypothetical protein